MSETAVQTNKIVDKLEKVVAFTLGQDRFKTHKIIVGESSPATDGTNIFLPRKNDHFKKKEDNEFCLANSTAHEADHIVECYECFGDEMNKLLENKTPIIGEYMKRNYSHLSENPALAGEIDNIVKDRRIDHVRRETFPGIKKYYEELANPAIKYFRPSIKKMNDLDAFRELYLQKALVGTTVDEVPKKYEKLLEEIVTLTNSADSIHKDPKIVTEIYELFKKNFDIEKPISRLPPPFGMNSNSNSRSSGAPQPGYGKSIPQREGRNDDSSKPKDLKDDAENSPIEEKGDNKIFISVKGENENKHDNKNDKNFYSKTSKKNDFSIKILKPSMSKSIQDRKASLEYDYYGEVESMKRVFRQLQLKNYGDKKDFHGLDIEYEDYMQSELESKITGIKSGGKYFNTEIKNQRKPVFGIHADISGSTRGKIIDEIRASFYIIGNALSASDWNYGLYASNEEMKIIKSPTQKWNDNMNDIISSLDGGGEGIYLEQTSSIIAADLKRLEGSPRCMIVISDFEVCGDEWKEISIAKKLKDKKIYPFYIAIGKENRGYVEKMASEIGEEYYSVIPKNKLHELPNEIFRIFKAYGVAK